MRDFFNRILLIIPFHLMSHYLDLEEHNIDESLMSTVPLSSKVDKLPKLQQHQF